MIEEPQPKTQKRSHRKLAVALSVLLGVLIGSSLMVVNYAEGFAYLSNDPKACTNCQRGRDRPAAVGAAREEAAWRHQGS